MNGQIQAWEVAKARRQSQAAQLQVKYPQLVKNNGAQSARVTATKNIRIELKAAFPGVKFSVTSKSFSMGDSIDVSWTDGPTTSQVDAIIGKYTAGHFDGMTDCYNYERNAWTEAFGDAKYVHSSRSYSDALLARILARVADRYGVSELTVASYRNGSLWRMGAESGIDLQQIVHRALSRHTCSLTRETFSEQTDSEWTLAPGAASVQ